MLRFIYGLRIDAPGSPGEADGDFESELCWRNRPVEHLPLTAGQPNVAQRVGRDLIELFFVDERGGPACRFVVSDDGRRVESESLPRTTKADLDSLFYEPVMRTVLSQLGLISFHASALEKDGKAILIMGDKGAGKSTTSCALRQTGWRSMADDLVRIIDADGELQAASGCVATRVNADTAVALGFDVEAMETRWSRDEAPGNKLIAPGGGGGEPSSGVPIIAVFLLGRRDPATSQIACRKAGAVNGVRGLISNLTPDALNPAAPPSPQALRVVSGLMRQATVCDLTLPDRLGDLAASAATLDTLIARGLTDGD